MNKMQSQHQAKGFKVLSINLDATLGKAAHFLADYSANFDVIYDPKGKLAKQNNLSNMPSSFIIDRQGKVVSAHTGFTDTKRIKYEQEIVAVLAQ